MDRRVEQARLDSDQNYFNELGLMLEYLTKIAVAGALVCPVPEDRREIEDKIVQADSMGKWNAALGEVLKAGWIDAAAEVHRDFTQTVGSADWRYQAVHALRSAAAYVGVNEAEAKGGTSGVLRHRCETA